MLPFVADSRNEPFEGQDLEELAGVDDVSSGGTGDGLTAAAAARNGGVRAYSFGRGDLGALLHSDDADHAAADGPVALKDHWSVLQVHYGVILLVGAARLGLVVGGGRGGVKGAPCLRYSCFSALTGSRVKWAPLLSPAYVVGPDRPCRHHAFLGV